ncbi:zinc finger BED domain-containing protein 5-like [Zophobas morio]|uniref:zinc finger BED domain-containing protein 5-like n=1 Tax=Zophobas morio TaxID=2755281 RepID=UPI00308347A2
MEKFLSGRKQVLHDCEASTSALTRVVPKSKSRKYSQEYIKFGFTSTEVNEEERPLCVICSKILAADSMKPNKLKRHLETLHSEYVNKPRQFFELKLKSFEKQKTFFKKSLSVHEKALLASYKVSYRIARCKKPHTIGEELILPAAIEIVETMFGDNFTKQLQSIPLSNDTVARRISDIANDVQHQLFEKLHDKLFSIQLDEATDSNKDAHLIAYVRFCAGTSAVEELLFCKPIELKATALALFAILNDFVNEGNIEWKNCVGICTDGARAMSGRFQSMQTLVKQKSPQCVWTHCMIHREALASKEMSPGLNIVLTTVVTAVNYIKMRPLKSRIFSELCKDMGAVHSSLLFYCETRWLSRGRFLQRVYELREEIAIYLEEEHRPEAEKFRDYLFVMKLSYLVDIFEKLNILNLQLQGANTHMLDTSDKVTAFCKKLELWNRNVKQKNLEMFPNVDECVKTYKVEEQHIKIVFVTIENHLAMLAKNFKKYFFADENLLAGYDWVRDPFQNTPDGLSTPEEEIFIDFTASGEIKRQFSNKPLFEFWASLDNEFSALKTRALRILLPFSTSYLCETGFSAMAAMKTKYRSRLNVEKELRVSISQIKPRFENLCAAKQAQGSH